MAAGATYEPIATTTLTSSATTITLSSIPSGYTDLRMVAFFKLVGGPSGGVANEYFTFNGDTASNYSRTRLSGDGSAASSSNTTSSSGALQTFTPAAGGVGLSVFDIFSYSGSTYKTVLWSDSADVNAAGGIVCRAVGLWRSTAAINSITWQNAGDTYAAGTTITLYGIKAA
jgi:hypothetical protein